MNISSLSDIFVLNNVGAGVQVYCTLKSCIELLFFATL